MGINGYQLIILVVLALVILGPERLPDYAKKLAHWVRQLRVFAQDARVRFKEETGTDFDDVNWRQYDPRQYDPRRIIREALSEDYEQTRRAVGSVRGAAAIGPRDGSSSGAAAAGSVGSAAPSAGTGARADAAAGSIAPNDPRALFGGSVASGTGSPSTASSAVAAGLAGAASLGVTGRSVPEDSVPADSQPEQQPAPFDVDAT